MFGASNHSYKQQYTKRQLNSDLLTILQTIEVS